MTNRTLARLAAGAFALAGVIGGTVLVRELGTATDADPDHAALATSFASPSWAMTLAVATLPLLALAGSVILGRRR